MAKFAELVWRAVKHLLFTHMSLTDTFPQLTDQNTFIQICFFLKGIYCLSQNSSSIWRYEWFQRYFKTGLFVAAVKRYIDKRLSKIRTRVVIIAMLVLHWLGASSFIGFEAQEGLGNHLGLDLSMTLCCWPGPWMRRSPRWWAVHNDEWLLEPDHLETMIRPSEEKMRLLRRDYESNKGFQIPT